MKGVEITFNLSIISYFWFRTREVLFLPPWSRVPETGNDHYYFSLSKIKLVSKFKDNRSFPLRIIANTEKNRKGPRPLWACPWADFVHIYTDPGIAQDTNYHQIWRQSDNSSKSYSKKGQNSKKLIAYCGRGRKPISPIYTLDMGLIRIQVECKFERNRSTH